MELFASQNQEEPRRVSLVRLSAEIARSAAGLGRVAVEGEVVKPVVTSSGRVYLTLRDRAARVRVACPAARAARCRTVHGERVRVTGRVEYLSDRGLLQLVAEEVVPVGAGAVAAAVQEARTRLAAEGLLDRRRRPLPKLPAAVGVICGGGSAVRADIESVVSARYPGYPVHFLEVGVSGPGAPEGIIAALADLERRDAVEVIVLARGGGDAADLLTFSDEPLCRAIASCSKPVVSAIGHHGDRPLCDEVADRRCATPSVAAAEVVPDEAELRQALASMLAGALSGSREAISAERARLGQADPAAVLDSALGSSAQRLERVSARLGAVDLPKASRLEEARLGSIGWREALERRLALAEGSMTGRGDTLAALDPARILQRGYAVVRTKAGEVLRSSREAKVGELLEVSLAEGSLDARVEAQR